ncbi:MAG: hypothetical protein WCS43_02925 [Verrucomicrobiota bacterium]
MKSPLLFLVFLATAMIALGSNTLRDWKTNSGKIYTADLVSYDEAVNGNQDPRGDYQLKRDTVRLQQAGCKISVHMFEGGHQVPPPSVQEKAFRWLLSNE